MNSEPFITEIIINSPASEIWNAITDKDEMKKWYFDIEEFEPKEGFEFQFWGGDENKKFLHLCKVTEVIPEKKISYSWKYNELPVETLVMFEIFDEGNKRSKVRLTHDGVENFPQDENFKKENFVAGWNYLIGTSLKNYLEEK
jgi:uncharacterized protein YndB with AHSA1/START domain